MNKLRIYGAMGLLLISAPIADYQWRQWNYWNNFERIIVWDNWKVALPQGDSITYRNQSPRMRLNGPVDTTKLLVWQKADGQRREYVISNIGGGYGDVEFRIRADGKGVWLISHDWKQVVTALDLRGGEFIGEGGIVYDLDGSQNMNVKIGFPDWAGLKMGRSLGRKKF